MLDHGHTHALSYPVGMVFVEAGFVVKRVNAQLATETSLLQMALSSIPSMSVSKAGTARAARELAKHLKELRDGKS